MFSTEHKIHDVDQRATLREKIAAEHAQGRTVVFTNGCFDLFHRGHLELLQAAGGEGDLLVVGLNTDASVKVNKGEERPILPEGERARVLASLACVDHVILFDEDSVAPVIEDLDPDVLMKGGDYESAEILGAASVSGRGKRVVCGPHIRGLSSTDLIERMRRAGG
jgi:D-beta-D-heptose 7-phosphate kinase/D-beta-D-heptose 1-phosphate adenosyltransferase